MKGMFLKENINLTWKLQLEGGIRRAMLEYFCAKFLGHITDMPSKFSVELFSALPASVHASTATFRLSIIARLAQR